MPKQWDASLTSQDIELIMEMIGQWEEDGPADKLRMIRFLKDFECDVGKIMDKAPEDMPEDIKKAFEEYFEKMKKDLLPNEKNFKRELKVRQERAVFLKAKFLLLQQEKSVDELFNSSLDEEDSESDSSSAEETTPKAAPEKDSSE